MWFARVVGEEIKSGEFTRADHQRYRARVERCLNALSQLLADNRFAPEDWRTGMEIELNLVDDDLQPFYDNAAVLQRVDPLRYQPELGLFTIELNVEPRRLGGQSLQQLESGLRAELNDALARARRAGAEIVMIGVLPTLPPPPPNRTWLSDSERYRALDEVIMTSRREPILLCLDGVESLSLHVDSIAAEAACTSTQLHLQVRPERFADYWNAAQVLAGPQVALGANSPFVFGRQVQAETRIDLFMQSTDIRGPELRNQGVRPLVWFGERWITSVMDLFEENLRYYPVLLPESSEEDPLTVLADGGIPRLAELRLHNGTIYRWNRPIYDVQGSHPHLRLENRVLPAGPSVIDTLANAAFFSGLIVELANDADPVWQRMPFHVAQDNFQRAAADGIEAVLWWPGVGEAPISELTLSHLLPTARRGLERLEVAAEVTDRLLDVTESRARLRRNGAQWQVAAVRAAEARGATREQALREMLGHYVRNMHANEPVHSWEVPS